jgi:hypothetical protein
MPIGKGSKSSSARPHHQTTEHDKGPRESAPQPAEPPGEAHRDGPLPYQKR